MGRRPLGDLRHDLDRLAGGQQAVHAGRADADALLAAAHPQAVELRAVEQLAEDQGDLLSEDARPVVLHADLVAVLRRALDVDPDFGQDAGLFAGVQGVVDRLLDGGQQGLAGVVETQQVAVLGEELADRMSRWLAAIDWAVARRRPDRRPSPLEPGLPSPSPLPLASSDSSSTVVSGVASNISILVWLPGKGLFQKRPEKAFSKSVNCINYSDAAAGVVGRFSAVFRTSGNLVTSGRQRFTRRGPPGRDS